METIPKVRNRVGIVISEDNAKGNPHVITPVDVTVCEAEDKEFAQLHEVEHIRLQEAIR